jgi:hypothetical protein
VACGSPADDGAYNEIGRYRQASQLEYAADGSISTVTNRRRLEVLDGERCPIVVHKAVGSVTRHT